MSAQTIRHLQENTTDRLDSVFSGSTYPEENLLEGKLEGNVPGVRTETLIGLTMKPIEILSSLNLLPWQGKSFKKVSDDTLKGVNRLLLDRIELFPFETFKGTSMFDGQSCMVLNYDIPENPFFMKFIRDELRQVDDELFLGQMFLTVPLYNQSLLYFALENKR